MAIQKERAAGLVADVYKLSLLVALIMTVLIIGVGIMALLHYTN